MSSYDIFMRDNYDKICNITSSDLYDLYKEFVARNGYQLCSSRTLVANIKKYTGESKAKRINGKPTKVYNLLPEAYAEFKKYHDDLEAEILKEEDNNPEVIEAITIGS